MNIFLMNISKPTEVLIDLICNKQECRNTPVKRFSYSLITGNLYNTSLNLCEEHAEEYENQFNGKTCILLK